MKMKVVLDSSQPGDVGQADTDKEDEDGCDI